MLTGSNQGLSSAGLAFNGRLGQLLQQSSFPAGLLCLLVLQLDHPDVELLQGEGLRSEGLVALGYQTLHHRSMHVTFMLPCCVL